MKNGMKFNWNQTGMPAALVSRLGQRNELAELKTVLHEAGNHVMRAVDAEAMARELLESGSREVVEMVRDLTAALAQAEKELASANRRYEQLTEDLERRGIGITEEAPRKSDVPDDKAVDLPGRTTAPSADPAAEWEEWDRRFQSLLA